MFNGFANFFASPDDQDPGFIRLTRNILIFTLGTTVLLGAVVISSSSMRGSIAPLVLLAVLCVLEIAVLLLLYFAGMNLLQLIFYCF